MQRASYPFYSGGSGRDNVPIITVSRGTLSGAEALCEAVAADLRIPRLSREILAEAANERGLHPSRMRKALDDAPGRWDRYARDRELYLMFIRATLYNHALDGDFIYEGHHAHFLLRRVPNVLRIRVVAPMEQRVKRVMNEKGLTQKKAEAYIKRIDKRRAAWARFLYGVRWENPFLYDLTMNFENITCAEASDAVVAIASGGRYRCTDATQKLVRDLALEEAVRCRLAEADQLFGTDLDIQTEAGVVSIKGHVEFSETRDTIGALAAGVEGVSEVQNMLETRADSFRRHLR